MIIIYLKGSIFLYFFTILAVLLHSFLILVFPVGIVWKEFRLLEEKKLSVKGIRSKFYYCQIYENIENNQSEKPTDL